MTSSSRWLLASTAIYLLPLQALAADLPARAPAAAPAPIMQSVYNWSGLYVGLQGGGQQLNNSFASILGTLSRHSTGAIIGGHLGYNLQSGSLVYGVEADLEYAAPNKLREGVSENGFEWQAGLVQGSARARFGLAFDRALIYATGGVAFMSSKATYFPLQSFSNTHTGWTVGGGLEYALTNQWSARVEYRYSDFGHANHAVNLRQADVRTSLTSHAVRVGLSYHFSSAPSAVVAKY